MILYLLFVFLMIGIFGRLIRICLKMAWGAVKICFRLIFLPIALVVMVVAGLIIPALVILAVLGVLSFIIW
ncbi:MAG: hypothetical protein HUJ69_07875 [Lachnospiraceae bacterium]|nr:hypothetical protein [Lachnospiraceae bacterium]